MAIKIKDIVKGTTRAINVNFVDQNGLPHDLTGGKVFFAATKLTAPTDDSGAAIDITPVTIHTDPVNGKSRIVLSAATTSIPAATYNVGAKAVLADGTVVENTGTLRITQDYKIGTT